MNRSDFKRLLAELSEELKADIAKAKADLAVARTTASASLKSLQEKDQTAGTKLNEFDQKITELNQHITKLQSTLNEINAIRDSALNPETGIQDGINKINSAKEQVLSLKQEVSDIRDLSKKHETELATLVSESRKSKQTIDEAEQASSETVKKIEKIYQLAADTGLAGSYDRRKSQIQIAVWIWGGIFILSIIVLIVLAIVFVVYNQDILVNELFIIRLLFFTPLVGLLVYSSVQYSRERNLLEKYAFKAAMALALESYTELLSKRFKNKYEEKIVHFVLSAMESIYKEPHAEPKKLSYKFGFNNKFGNLGAEVIEELEDKISEIKEAKNIVTSGQSKDSPASDGNISS